MGKHFGELAKIRGLITYKLSPHEQRAYAGAISNGIPNMFRRFRESVFRVAPGKYSRNLDMAIVINYYGQMATLPFGFLRCLSSAFLKKTPLGNLVTLVLTTSRSRKFR